MGEQPIKVLVLEDNPGGARLIREMLSGAAGASFELESADRLAARLARLEASGTEVVLLHHPLPESRGRDTSYRVRVRVERVPIIVLTGLGGEELAPKMVQEGAQDYLVKGPADGNILAYAIRCAIERHRAEQTARMQMAERQKAEQELEQIFELSPDLLCFADLNGYFRRLNPAWEKTLGYSREELLAKPYVEFVHPEDRERTLDEAARLTRGGKTVSFENRYLAKDGSQKWFLWNAISLAEQERIYGAARDITERKHAEEEIQTLHGELTQRVSERTAMVEAINSELEAFSYSVSHDLRAPLRHIDGFSRILLDEYAARLEPQAQHYLQRIAEAALRMGHLVDDLLELSRLGRREVTRRPTELEALVREVLTELAPTLGHRRVEWRIESLPVLECDPGLMKLVFSNLLSNALKFTRPCEPAAIWVGSKEFDGQLAVFVQDNGVGFDQKYADKLFGVFQRLHREEDFEGTGIGLATVQRIIRKHGGQVWAESQPNHGATFYFTLGPPGVRGAETISGMRGGACCQKT